jgi:hypothetical protein
MVLEYIPGGPVYDPEKFQHKVGVLNLGFRVQGLGSIGFRV